MNKQSILKIAGVKTEKEFYKKYKTEEAFMKQHGKAFKKAQMGTLIGGGSPKQFNSQQPELINFQDIYDASDKANTGSTAGERSKSAYDQAMLEAQAAKGSGSEGGGGGMGDIMGMVGGAMKMFGGSGGEGGGGDSGAASMDMGSMGSGARYGTNIPRAYSGFSTPNWWNNATTTDSTTLPTNRLNNFGIGAQTMGRMQGPPATQPTNDFSEGGNGMFKDPNAIPLATSNVNKGSSVKEGEVKPQPSGFTKAMKGLDPTGTLGALGEGYDMLRSERRARKQAEQDRAVSDVTLKASSTREEESKRKYVRPEDIQNTGEEFFPIYGVGTNVLSRNGGRFQNGGGIGGNPTEIQNTYDGGNDIYTDGGYEPLNNPFQQKDFRHGGYLHVLQDGGSAAGGASGGGTPYGQIGHMATGTTQTLMGGQNGGGKIGGTIGQKVGSIFGPIGGMVGEVVGGIGGQLLDTNQRDTDKENDRTKSNTATMAMNSGMQSLQAQNNRYVRNGGDIPNYEDGGYMNPEYNPQVITMFGDHNAQDFADYAHKDQYRAGGHLKSYTPPSERAMETYAMGGQLQTHWGGKAETLSHNPYMPGSGETVAFRGQSHNESDGQGNTGIGITYGDNPVEVERGEPMFEMASGGEVNPQTGESENTGVVFGNMQVNKNIAAQFKDPELMAIADKYNGKKFKNIGIELAKQEAKHNKAITKNTDALEALKVNTPFDKLTFSALKANLEGADTGLKNIANTKITLANYQNAINDAKDEISEGMGKNISAEHLAKGYVKLDKDPVTKDAKWGATVSKAKDGITTTKETTVVPTTFKSNAEASAAGYHKTAGGTWARTIHKYSTKDSEKKSAEALDHVPKGQKKHDDGTWGGVTPEKFAATKAANAWYPGWSTFNPNNKTDVKNYQASFNARAKAMGSPANINVDGDFGDQTVSARIAESKQSNPANTDEELTATVATPAAKQAVEEKYRFPWEQVANQGLKWFRPSDQEELDNQQLYPEWNAMASNQLDPVPAQGYQPDLNVPYDISLQNERNAVVARDRALQKQLGYNPSAQSNAAPLGYNAINDINAREFQMNQAEKDKVYSGNRATMNEAQKMNLGIYADQWGKQALAKSNTKATTQAALNSIADKYAKHKLENRTLGVYENMYNYRFGKSGKAQNWNGLQFFDTTVGGDKKKGVQDMPGYKAISYDKDGNVLNWKKITDKEDSDVDESALEAIPGAVKNKNGSSIKKNQKNSSVVRAYKNL